MRRRLFTFCSALSLLLSVAVGVLWAWSYAPTAPSCSCGARNLERRYARRGDAVVSAGVLGVRLTAVSGDRHDQTWDVLTSDWLRGLRAGFSAAGPQYPFLSKHDRSAWNRAGFGTSTT